MATWPSRRCPPTKMALVEDDFCCLSCNESDHDNPRPRKHGLFSRSSLNEEAIQERFKRFSGIKSSDVDYLALCLTGFSFFWPSCHADGMWLSFSRKLLCEKVRKGTCFFFDWRLNALGRAHRSETGKSQMGFLLLSHFHWGKEN